MKKKDKSSVVLIISDSFLDIEDDLDIISEYGGWIEDLFYIGVKNFGFWMFGKVFGLVGFFVIFEDFIIEDGVVGIFLVLSK